MIEINQTPVIVHKWMNDFELSDIQLRVYAAIYQVSWYIQDDAPLNVPQLANIVGCLESDAASAIEHLESLGLVYRGLAYSKPQKLRKPKKKVVEVSEEAVRRYESTKTWLKSKIGPNHKSFVFETAKRPLTLEEFERIYDDYDIEENHKAKVEFLNVIKNMENNLKVVQNRVSANQTIRDWLNRSLGISSVDEIIKKERVKNLQEQIDQMQPDDFMSQVKAIKEFFKKE